MFFGILNVRNMQKGCQFSNAAFLKKDGHIPHEKCHFLSDMDFLVKEIANLTSNFA
jgi:hypothetical protein